MNILILADTDLSMDARIRRHIFALKDRYKLIVTGTKNPEISDDIEFIDCSKREITNEELQKKRKKLRIRMAKKQYEEAYWEESYIKELYSNLKHKQIDFIISNDVTMLPIGVRLAKEKKIKIIADMHEYAPRQFEDLEHWRNLLQNYIYYFCREYLPSCDEIITVSSGIAREYEKEFKVKVNNIINNAPKYQLFDVKKTERNNIKMVYHGAANSSRNLQNLIDIVENLDDRFSLTFYLNISENDCRCNEEFFKRIEKSPKCILKKPVQPEQIVETIHNYDIGLFLLKPVNFNYKYALPNKFFEFAQARLAIAIGPSIEMKYYVDKYKCGIVSEDFNIESLTSKLNKLTIEDIDKYKLNSCELSKDENWEKNSEKLLLIVENLLKN